MSIPFTQNIYQSRNTQIANVCDKYGLSPEFFKGLNEGRAAEKKKSKNGSSRNSDIKEYVNAAQSQAASYKLTIDKTLLYNAPHQLTYCWVRKVASSSWNDIYWQLAGVKNVRRYISYKYRSYEYASKVICSLITFLIDTYVSQL